MKKVRALYRVSTDKQVDKDDIPLQENACRSMIASHADWVLDYEYYEKGVSAFKVAAIDRSILQDVINDAKAGLFDILVLYHTDRLSRDALEYAPVLQSLSQYVEVWTYASGDITIRNHNDLLKSAIDGWQAEGESQKTSQRVDDKMRQMVQQNLYRGGPPPFGYKLVLNGRFSDRDRKQRTELYDMVIEEVEADIVKLIYRLADDRYWGGKRIAAYLAKEGYLGRAGKEISPRFVSWIIGKPIYKGIMTYGRSSSKKSVLKKTGNQKSVKMPEEHMIQGSEFNPNWVIIDAEQWQRVNEDKIARLDKKMTTELMMPRKSQLLLVGLVKCGYCGRKFRTQNKTTTSNGKKYSYLYYDCVGRINRMPDCILKSAYTQKSIEEPVIEMVRQYLKDLKSNRKNKSVVNLTENQRFITSEIEKSKTKLVKSEKELAVLNDEIMKVLLGESGFSKNKLSELIEIKEAEVAVGRKYLEQYQGKLNAIGKELKGLSRLSDEIVTWVDIFDEADLELKKSILAKLIDVVVITKSEIDIKFKFTTE